MRAFSCRESHASRTPGRAARRRRLRGLIAVSLLGGAACLAAGPKPEDEPALDPARRAEQIEALRAAIEHDHATLQALITRPRAADEVAIYDDPEMRAIAARLTEQVQRLERLEAVRDAEAVER